MLSDEEKKEYEELKSLLYTGTISQYGKRKLINIIEKQQKEIEELKEDNKKKSIVIIEYQDLYEKLEDKIKAKIEEYEEKIKKIKEKDVWEEPYDTEKYVRYTNYISVLQSLLEKE